MNLNKKILKYTSQLNENAIKLNFKMIPLTEKDIEEGIRNIAKWERPNKDWVTFRINEPYDGSFLINYSRYTCSGKDYIEDWISPAKWKYEFGM